MAHPLRQVRRPRAGLYLRKLGATFVDGFYQGADAAFALLAALVGFALVVAPIALLVWWMAR